MQAYSRLVQLKKRDLSILYLANTSLLLSNIAIVANNNYQLRLHPHVCDTGNGWKSYEDQMTDKQATTRYATEGLDFGKHTRACFGKLCSIACLAYLHLYCRLGFIVET